jgi:CDP-diacylglycerol---serine O-phosphatidyltransferase
VVFAVASSAIISLQTKAEFVLVWLLSFYVVIGLVETVITFPSRRREARRDRTASERSSLPPSSPH